MRGSSFQKVLLIYEGNLRIGRRLIGTNSQVGDLAEYNDSTKKLAWTDQESEFESNEWGVKTKEGKQKE